MSEEKNPALAWAAERASMPYDRFVDGLTAETVARIQAAYTNRFVNDAGTAGQAPAEEKPEEKNNIDRIRTAFRVMKRELPHEISPETYKHLLEEMDVHSKQEKEMLGAVVKEELGKAQQLENRAKLTHFLWWLNRQ